jgi:hypothetical protein
VLIDILPNDDDSEEMETGVSDQDLEWEEMSNYKGQILWLWVAGSSKGHTFYFENSKVFLNN